jgi:hypothetical protein
MLRTYSTYIGPGRFAESPFQCRRSNAGGVSPFQVIVDDVIPHELVGAQARERAGELAAAHALPGEQCRFPRRQCLACNVDADVARIREVEHGGEEA